MLLSELVQTSRQIGETPRRTEKAAILADLLRQLAPEEIETAVAWLSGALRQGKIGAGYAVIRDAMGAPAPQPTLRITDVTQIFDRVAATTGRGSSNQRQQLLQDLFARATEQEQHFLVGLLMGEIRQGALEGIMLEALSKAFHAPVERVRRAVMMAGDVTPVARTLAEQGEGGLKRYNVQLFRPVQPMLAQTAEDAAEAIEALGQAALEYKMDGARVQAHRSGDDVVVYSRSLKDVTAAVPEVVEAVKAFPGKELILDGEVISLMADQRPHPFQVTMRRFGRRLEVDRMRAELPLTPFWFDLLYQDGSLMEEQQYLRFQTLLRLAPQDQVIPHKLAATPEDAAKFLEEALAAGHEGIMAKSPEAPYAAGARGQSWLKIKQTHTLDLVILAAEWGHGRRRGCLSNLHLGARDESNGGYAMLGKTFKGLTDEMLAWQTQELLKLEIGRDSNTVHVEPKLVAEIAFNDIQISPRYRSGLALRFARVKRYRQDKNAAEADTFETVQRMAGISE